VEQIGPFSCLSSPCACTDIASNVAFEMLRSAYGALVPSQTIRVVD